MYEAPDVPTWINAKLLKLVLLNILCGQIIHNALIVGRISGAASCSCVSFVGPGKEDQLCVRRALRILCSLHKSPCLDPLKLDHYQASGLGEFANQS